MAYVLEADVPEDVNQSYSDDFSVSFHKKFLNIAHSYRVTVLHPFASYGCELHRLQDYLRPKLSEYMESKEIMKYRL